MGSRLRPAFVLGALLPGAVLAGCTFLVSFDDIPADEDDAGGLPDVRSRDRDSNTGVDVTTPVVDATPSSPTCDPTFPLDEIECGTATRSICASSLGSYPAGQDRERDLVRCGPSGATCVIHCPFGCEEMKNGFPAQCNPCNGRADGYHCGYVLPDSPPENADLAIQCRDGAFVEAAVCGKNRCASPCSRDGGPTPSCCI